MGSIPQLSIVKGQHRDLKSQRLSKIFEVNLTSWSTNTAMIYNCPRTSKQNQITYEDLNAKSNRIARAIIRESAQRFLKPNQDNDSIIAVCMEPTDKLVMILLSIWKSGAAYLPLEPSFPTNRIHHILNESKPLMVICDDIVDTTIFQKTHTLRISDLLHKASTMDDNNLSDCKLLPFSNKDLAIVLYTSGSTGIPKGVRIPHAVILNRLTWQWEQFPYMAEESIGVFKTALTFVDSVSEIWGPLLYGMSILVIPKVITKDPERLVEYLEKYKIRRLVLVPTLLRSLLLYLGMNKNQQLLYDLKYWICSGEPLSITLAKSFYEYFQEGHHTLFNFYGSTEVMGDVTYFICENRNQLANFDRIPIGIPINNTIIYLLDQDYRPVKNGEIGEIFVAGYNLAAGYVNGRDEHRFIENPLAVDSKYSKLYRTGDFGSLNNGYLMYEGRTDSQIKIRGHRVDLSEIEKNLLRLEYIEKAVVLCYHAGEIDQAILAFVKLDDDSKPRTGLHIESALKDALPTYMIPQVIIIDKVPLLVNGKVDRQALLKSYENANNNEDSEIIIDYDYSDVPESLQIIAEDLFETVGSVIGRSTRTTLSVKSNFYELGGNSLNSIYTVTKLREKGYFIGISEFIGAKNLGEILKKISKGNVIEMEEDDVGSTLNLKAYPLRHEDREIVIEIITESFYEKADLEQWLKPDILPSDYYDILTAVWGPLVEKGLSFIVKNGDTNETIAAALNFDARDEPAVEVNNKMVIIFDFLEYLEGPIRDNYLPKGLNKILHSFMMGTDQKLSAQENIVCMHFMESEVLKLAKSKKFAGIFTTNTSPLTQQLGGDVYGYKTLLDYQVNKYVHSDGWRPFAKAPDSQRAIVHWKAISDEGRI
ncbi:beta-alanyl-bioamine nonribosomal peptide synthetase ebony [Condylostylus longicornis]|uniref:beta-alanyl-bioamine nonribosomal peptide synthetase ebony n=1 Tax=Condylostylus longicornis TaxID=2530218 RepID=UPI00244DCEC2|nr:beta-alanyl-bioamine nonribosomal peptide synthetase ebony [Condylostylus longicornis]